MKAGKRIEGQVVQQRAPSLAGSIEHHAFCADPCRSSNRVEIRQGVGEENEDETDLGRLGLEQAEAGAGVIAPGRGRA